MTGTGRAARFLPEEVWLPFSESLFEWDERFHDLLLNDRIRVEAYRAAIQRTVRPGMTVLDLGTGTGILAQWALEAGALRVYGIEMNRGILDEAVRRMAASGHAQRFVPVCEVSFDATLPERVDVLISEIIGNLADNENFVPILRDATARFLASEGIQIPRCVVSYIVPVEARSAHEQISQGRWQEFGRRDTQGKTVSRLGQAPFDRYYDTILPLSGYLAEPRELRRFGGSWTDDPAYSTRKIWQIGRKGFLTGFKGYFVAELADGVVLDISGDDVGGRTSSDSWKHAFLPIEIPVAVEAGDTLQLDFARNVTAPAGAWGHQAYVWSGYVRRYGEEVATFYQNTGRGIAPLADGLRPDGRS